MNGKQLCQVTYVDPFCRNRSREEEAFLRKPHTGARLNDEVLRLCHPVYEKRGFVWLDTKSNSEQKEELHDVREGRWSGRPRVKAVALARARNDEGRFQCVKI